MANKTTTPSYDQPEKERSRELVWNHAVETLTSKRNDNRILNLSYMEHLWLYCQQTLDEKLDIETFIKWKEFAEICYGNRHPEELKVAFFCGPEPENDVRHLLQLGIRIENIYAFEYDKDIFKAAVESLHDSYPLLKIYRGKLEKYAELQNVKFDIVYLDFTRSLLVEYKAVVRLLDMNALSDMSVLAVNTTYPDKTKENIRFLANFFYNDTFFELSVLEGKDREREEGDTWFYRCEGCDAYNIMDIEALEKIVEKNFEQAYSAFQTAFILDYANYQKPAVEVFSRDILKNRILKESVFNKIKGSNLSYHDVLSQSYFDDGQRLSSSQIIDDEFSSKSVQGSKLSHTDCIKHAEVFIQSPYRHTYSDYTKISEWSKLPEDQSGEMPIEDVIEVDMKNLLTNEVRTVIDDIDKWFHGKYTFCDLPMEHLWLELLLYQFGHPYHTNVGNHRRYSYTAKTRKMCIDIFTLDKCRALYDWMPMLEYFVYDMQNHNRQMITRMCMDAIDKQLLHIVNEVYMGAALVGMNEFDWSCNKVLPNREEITIANSKPCVIKRIAQSVKKMVLDSTKHFSSLYSHK